MPGFHRGISGSVRGRSGAFCELNCPGRPRPIRGDEFLYVLQETCQTSCVT